ncbi:MAG: hypothetical protein KC589_06090 [Nanoarchaeota archaeon]|nr:hypothetical protein [Nanoarchaeota archaeon]
MNKHLKIFKMMMAILRDRERFYGNTVSFIVYKNEIISIGYSTSKTHPFQKRFGKTPNHISLHAEVDAIHKASKRLSDKEFSKATIYVARLKHRINSYHEVEPMIGISKPCSGCTSAIITFGIRNVFYTIDSEINNIKFDRW